MYRSVWFFFDNTLALNPLPANHDKTAVQIQQAVSAYLQSKQILPLGFAR